MTKPAGTDGSGGAGRVAIARPRAQVARGRACVCTKALAFGLPPALVDLRLRVDLLVVEGQGKQLGYLILGRT